MSKNFLIGTYTKKYSKGIYKFTLDSNDNGSFEKRFKLHNPTYIDIKNNFLISSHGDSNSGGVVLFSLKNDFLIPLDKAEDFNCPPCFVEIYKDYVLSCNYHQGLFILYKITSDYSLKKLNSISIENGKLHCCRVYKDKLYIVDLNNSSLNVYSFPNLKPITKINLEKKSKPRHLDFKDNFVYLITEGTYELFQIDIDTLSISNSIKPLNFNNDLEGAAIHIYDNFIYTSERKTNTFSVFKILENNSLKHIQNFSYKKINSPRDFILDSDKLFSCNLKSDSISIFSLKNGIIDKFSNEIPIPEPICIKKI
ncbi:lactonase family protein [Clostridium thermobutyricum]